MNKIMKGILVICYPIFTFASIFGIATTIVRFHLYKPFIIYCISSFIVSGLVIFLCETGLIDKFDYEVSKNKKLGGK